MERFRKKVVVIVLMMKRSKRHEFINDVRLLLESKWLCVEEVKD
jgi:hypothetical protein